MTAVLQLPRILCALIQNNKSPSLLFCRFATVSAVRMWNLVARSSRQAWRRQGRTAPERAGTTMTTRQRSTTGTWSSVRSDITSSSSADIAESRGILRRDIFLVNEWIVTTKKKTSKEHQDASCTEASKKKNQCNPPLQRQWGVVLTPLLTDI
jgi:hypothetical protein